MLLPGGLWVVTVRILAHGSLKGAILHSLFCATCTKDDTVCDNIHIRCTHLAHRILKIGGSIGEDGGFQICPRPFFPHVSAPSPPPRWQCGISEAEGQEANSKPTGPTVQQRRHKVLWDKAVSATGCSSGWYFGPTVTDQEAICQPPPPTVFSIAQPLPIHPMLLICCCRCHRGRTISLLPLRTCRIRGDTRSHSVCNTIGKVLLKKLCRKPAPPPRPSPAFKQRPVGTNCFSNHQQLLFQPPATAFPTTSNSFSNHQHLLFQPPATAFATTSNSFSNHQQQLLQPPATAFPTTSNSFCNHQQLLLQPPATAFPTTSNSFSNHQQQLLQPPATAFATTSNSFCNHQQQLLQPPATAFATTSNSFSNHQQQLFQPPATAFATTSNSFCNHQQQLLQPLFKHPSPPCLS